MKKPQIITDVNVMLSGQGKLGIVKEFKPPTIEKEIKMQENGGLTRPVDMGFFKELKIEFTLQQIPPEAMSWLAVSKFTDTPVLFKASIYEQGRHLPWMGTAKGILNKLEPPTLSAKAEVETKYEMSINSWSEVLDGKELVMIDTENLICLINGEDQLASVRTHLM